MPCIRSRKASSGSLPYTSSKPKAITKVTKPTKKPTTRKTKGKVTTSAAAAAAAAIAAAEEQEEEEEEEEDASTKRRNELLSAIWQSEFVATEAALPPTALGDLSNAILPIFRAANFPNVKDYAVIEPSVRLASHLLKHPSLCRMLRTILKHGDLVPLNENESHGKPLHQYPDDTADDMTADDVALIDASLDELSGFVTFRLKKKHNPASALTVPIVRRAKPDHRTENLRGQRSRIEYARALLHILTKAHNAPAKKQDVPLILLWRFQFAVQLAHEICHALIIAKDGHKTAFDTEPFFHGDTVSEVGFTMEEKLFGGSPALLWSDGKPKDEGAMLAHYKSKSKLSDFVGVLVLWPWPCTWIVRDYQADNGALFMRKADLDALDPKDVAWRVPLLDLARFFETEFWEHENPSTRLARTVGIVFSCDEDGVRSPAEVSKQELSRYTPGGYRVSKHKAIVRKQGLRGKSASLV